MKALLGLLIVFLVTAATLPTASGDDKVPKHSAVVELVGTFEGVPVGADPKKPYYPVTIHEVVVDPSGLFANPNLKKDFRLRLMDADVKMPKRKSRLFVKPPDANSGSWLLIKGTEIK